MIALALLVGGAVVVRQFNGASNTAPTLVAAAPPTTQTTAPSILPPVAQVDLTHPFANTPAATWQEGAAGFTVAPATKVGAFSASQVTDAFDQVEKAVTAAHLDRQMLEVHDSSTLLSLLAPNEAKFLKGLLNKPDKTEADGYVTLLADRFHLLPSNPRLEGRLTALPGAGSGELTIHAEYVIAYAFDTPNPGQLTSPGDIVAFERDDKNFTIVTGSHFTKSDQGLRFGNGSGEYFSMACSSLKTGYLAPAYSDPNLSGTGTDPQQEAAIYNLDKPMDLKDDCGS
jgi:hypothetical protein